MRNNIIVFILIGLSHFSFCQTVLQKEKLDAYFHTLEEANKFMGSVAVSKNGELIYTNAVGYADVDKGIEATTNTKYRIGSITKTFTAVLTLKAIEQEKLNLDQSIDKWFSSIKNADKITVSMLLGHRSGLHNFTDDPAYLTYNTISKTEDEMLRLITDGGSDFEPDSRSAYSNSNYVLLTFILEKIYNQSFSNLLKKEIIQPLNLTDTYVFKDAIDVNANESRSYRKINSWVEEPETHYSISLGAGAIASTPRDLNIFAQALFTGKLLTQESLKFMMTDKEGYGNGLFRIPFYEKIGYGHTGGIDGFTSVFAFFPEDEITFALISNGTAINTNDIAIAVLSAVYDKPYEIPSFTTYEVSSKDLDQYLGVYASQQIALKITFTKEGNTLLAQGTGQPVFPLEATEKDKFKSEQVGARIEFNPTQGTMTLFQGGGKILFTKE